MAGKGSKPRKVDGEKYRDNFDKIFGRSTDKEDFTKKTWEEWAEIHGHIIKSPDGFRNKPRNWRYYEKEYKDGLAYCTVYQSNAIREYLEER